MAATLTGAGDLLYASFPIDKVETDADGDLIVFGKASDGSVDSDQQIVAPSFMAAAAQAWKATGANLRVQHNAQRDPAGVGLEVETDSSGATWVKGLVIEPVAKRLVAKGALRAYSVGIARPTIERDPTGKARGGIITAGELVEISLVDRPANKACGIQLVKSAEDGTPEYVGKVFGSDDDIAKALGADVTKDAGEQSADMSTFAFPEDLSVTFTPNDMARLMQTKIVEKHYAGLAAQAADTEKRDFDPNVGGGVDRDKLPASSFAGPHRSFPVVNQSDVSDAMHLAGHADDPDQVRANVKRIANREGLSVPDDSDSKSKGAEEGVEQIAEKAEAEPEAPAVKEAEPEVIKDPEEAKDKPVKKAKKKKKLPPWLNKPDNDGKGDDSCKQDHAHTEKCKTTPAEAAGLSGTHDMTCAPVPELLESPPMASTKAGTPMSTSGAQGEHMTPVPQHREPDGAIVEPFEKDAGMPATGQGETPTPLEAGMMKSSPGVAAMMRFKRAGIDSELGRLHDLTCPAYHPEDVAKCHPFADFSTLDEGFFQRKAVEAACGPDMERAKSLNLAWQAARVLREADPAELNDYRLAAHKAFRDANPGPASAPTPGMIAPGKYNRPLITDGHEASSTGHDGPNSSPQVATTAPNAHGFDRPPLSAGHQSPSPSFMKASFEYPSEQGRPMQLNYAVMEKERARHALMAMHEHLSRQFPEACPMDLTAPPVQPESRGVPPTAGIGKSDTPEPAAPPVAAVFKAPAEEEGQFADAEVYKSFKKMRKKLGKKVLSGKMTVDEARSRMGRQFAQKGSDEEQETAQKSATVTGTSSYTGNTVAVSPGPEVAAEKAQMAELVKSAVAEALRAESVPLEPATVASFDPSPAIEAAVTKAVTPLLEKIQAQDTKLAETQRVIDAIADQPDPSTASFSGLAFNPVRKAARPAGVVEQSEIAERTQQMMIRHLQDKYNASSDPAEREAYYDTLAKMRGFGQ